MCRGLAPLDGFSQVRTALLLCGPGTADVCLGQSAAALPAGWKAAKTRGQGFLFTLCHLKRARGMQQKFTVSHKSPAKLGMGKFLHSPCEESR